MNIGYDVFTTDWPDNLKLLAILLPDFCIQESLQPCRSWFLLLIPSIMFQVVESNWDGGIWKVKITSAKKSVHGWPSENLWLLASSHKKIIYILLQHSLNIFISYPLDRCFPTTAGNPQSILSPTSALLYIHITHDIWQWEYMTRGLDCYMYFTQSCQRVWPQCREVGMGRSVELPIIL